MSESEQDAPAQPVAQAPVKRVSGMLIFSLISSLAGFLLIPVMLPALGLLLAWFGYRKTKVDPNLIGPRFAVWCMVIAALCTLGSGALLYNAWPQLQLREDVFAKQGEVFTALGERDYEKTWKLFDDDYRRATDLESFTALLRAAFPGEEKIVFTKDTLGTVDDEELAKRLQEDLEKFFDGELEEVDIPFVFTVDHEGAKVRMRFDYAVRRVSFSEFGVRIIGMTAERPEAPEPADEPATGTAGASAEENPR